MTLHVHCLIPPTYGWLNDQVKYPQVNLVTLEFFGLVFGRFTNESFSISEGHIGGRDTVPSIVRNDFLTKNRGSIIGRDKKKWCENIDSWNPLKKKRGKKKSRVRNLKELTYSEHNMKHFCLENLSANHFLGMGTAGCTEKKPCSRGRLVPFWLVLCPTSNSSCPAV